MALENISNPLLLAPEMRTSGQTLLAHVGSAQTLGAGQSIFVGIISPVEFVFRETAEGRRARGRHHLGDFYVLHQNTISTKIWNFLPNSQSWSPPFVKGLEIDDPTAETAVLALSYQEDHDPLISFYDSPGFAWPPHQTAGVDRQATRVFLLQTFQVWCDVSQRFSRGTFQASPARFWNNLICARRDNPDSMVWRASSAALVAGRATVDRPLCD